MKKYKPKHRDKKFDSKGEFEEWLKRTTKHKIELEDKGQDFLHIYCDEEGEILHFHPLSGVFSMMWNGLYVDIKEAQDTGRVLMYDQNVRYRELAYVAKRVLTVKE